ncbi:hypothetical protein O1611_g7964 [Lasiodiplodia mahajangana]|uniref:Uncharacterized protein n=1 Tax=Lasiodiplodia mahajangana TaxID=1108764 RepID=A0ACC2JDY5_9PEZI|nr:hypothetical protein O1611_g7964 [Lasiodiplodia mahajangana]
MPNKKSTKYAHQTTTEDPVPLTSLGNTVSGWPRALSTHALTSGSKPISPALLAHSMKGSSTTSSDPSAVLGSSRGSVSRLE